MFRLLKMAEGGYTHGKLVFWVYCAPAHRPGVVELLYIIRLVKAERQKGVEVSGSHARPAAETLNIRPGRTLAVAFQGLHWGSINVTCTGLQGDVEATLSICNSGINVPTVARVIIFCSSLKGLEYLSTKLSIPRMTSKDCFRSLRHPPPLSLNMQGEDQLSPTTGIF